MAGITTYRLYLYTPNETDFLVSCSGDDEKPLVLESTAEPSWFQHEAATTAFATDVNPIFFAAFPEFAFDSWLTIGAEDNTAVTEIIAIADPQLDPFVFDMSIPDSRAYLNSSLPVYMRMSEEEPVAAWLSKAEGVWLDAFSSVWYDAGVINDLLAKNKQICIVSPELHGRDAMDLWPLLDAFKHHHAVTLCTDIPEAAVDFFAGM